MNKEKQQEKPELFQVRKNYCWLTGYPANNGEGTKKQKPIVQTVKVKF